MYDNEGNICGIRYCSELYFFQKNLQGDVIAIKDSKGNTVARYRYDVWGVPTIVEDITPDDEDWEGDGIATVNPFRYRGYYYDNETGLYYLQSRYYDPTIGRFINADSPELCVSPSKYSIKNIFAYGDNNLVNNADYFGTDAIWLQDANAIPLAGHTGLLLRANNGKWWHFYWGADRGGKKGKSGPNVSMIQYFYPKFDLVTINKFYSANYRGAMYEDIIILKGDFSESVKYANGLSRDYNLIVHNCMQVSTDVLRRGRFTYYDAAYKTFLWRIRGLIPNIAYGRILRFNNLVNIWVSAPWYIKLGYPTPYAAALSY